jgi:small-conductance mechanosensitive channel
VPEVPQTGQLLEAFNPGALPVAAAWIVGTIIAVKLLARLMERVSDRIPSPRLILKQTSTLFAFVAYTLSFILAFNAVFNLSSEALFALSGTLAVTVGFALKDVAASFLAGISILVNKPFRVGDRISFGGYYGEVKEIGLRSIRIVTLDDNLVTVPSNKFLTEAVASANAGALDCMVVTRFYIPEAADHTRAREIVQDAVVSSKYLYLEKPYTVLVRQHLTERGETLVELTAKAYVYDMRFEKAFESDITDRVLSAFHDEGIPQKR